MDYETKTQWVYYMLSRRNPVLRPRRSGATARRWLHAVRAACTVSINDDNFGQWAAAAYLDVGNIQGIPDGWGTALPPSLIRWGGVEEFTLRQLAKFYFLKRQCLLEFCRDREYTTWAITWPAWALLYPRTAAYGTAVDGPYTAAAAADMAAEEAIKEEWDLIYDWRWCHTARATIKPEDLAGLIDCMTQKQGAVQDGDNPDVYILEDATVRVFRTYSAAELHAVEYTRKDGYGPIPQWFHVYTYYSTYFA